MVKKDVVVGNTYKVKVSGVVVPVKITQEAAQGGWWGKSEKTGRQIRIKTAGKLRGVI